VTLSDTGESRVRGYLYVLERSLVLALPREVAADAVREIESHLRERIAAVAPASDERAALEQILAELGPPLRVAQAYSAEHTIDEAVVTGRLVAVLRAMWHVALTSVGGFFAGIGLIVGYGIGLSCLLIAILKPVFPDNVGFWMEGGYPVSLGVKFPAEGHPAGGGWVILIGLFFGLAALVVTHRGARRFLAWWRLRMKVRLPQQMR
jgi:uncharacterized membrane protein